MSTITISWKAFGDFGDRKMTSLSFKTDEQYFDSESQLDFCEAVFAQTNIYSGPLWDQLEPDLPLNRTHTALSCGDEVSIDGFVYRCEPIGFQLLNPVSLAQ